MHMQNAKFSMDHGAIYTSWRQFMLLFELVQIQKLLLTTYWNFSTREKQEIEQFCASLLAERGKSLLCIIFGENDRAN